MDEALKDKRFSHILKDPRFRKAPKNLRKIKIDKRFAGMFDKNVFNDRCKVDERGRALELDPAENLKKLYNVTNGSSDEEEEDTNTKDSSKQSLQNEKISKTSKGKLQLKQTKKYEKKEISEQDSEISKDESQLKSKNKFLKKKEKGVSSNKIKDSSVKSSESEDSDSEDHKDLDLKESEKSESEESKDSESEESKDSESEESNSSSNETGSVQGDFDHHWEEFDEEAEMTEDITRRLAVCNMDWDRIRASDLFVVFDSFKPQSGSICSVKIYPSEFGARRMEEEKLKGPPELVEKTLASDEEEDLEDKKGAKFNQEKLRQYQINRLKYYYAVVECDTPETANHLYEQLNGLEYESSSVRFDLRFVPDDTTFDQEPTSVADSSPDPTEYKPRLFVTTALQQCKVNLTWDETDPQRRETLQKAFTDLDSVERDLKDYLASSSEESEVEAEVEEDGKKLSTKERIANYRALLNLEVKKDEMNDENEKEITWDPDVKEKTEKVVKEKLDSTSTPFDEILKKKKERRQKKQKEKLKMKNEANEIDSDDSDFMSDEESSKKSTKQLAELQLISDAKEIETSQEKKKGKKFKKKKKEQKKEEFKCDVTDPRFSAIYTSHDYNIDPSDPHFKKTEGTMAIFKEKQKQRMHEKDLPEERKSKKMKYR